MSTASRALPYLGWLSFAAATVVLLFGLLRQPVDATNRALKVPDTEDARRLVRLAAVTGADPTVVLGFLARGDLDVPPADREALAAIRERLLALPGVADCRETPVADPGLLLMVVAVRAEDPLATAHAVVATATASAPASLEVAATGLPLLEGTIAQLVAGERTTIVPGLLAVLLLAALACYRRVGLAVAVLLPPIVAIAWTGGAIAWLGHPLDPVAALLEPVLLTIGVAASVHFVEAYRRAAAGGDAPHDAARHARAALSHPAFWATATTMLGLWSLTRNDTPAVVDFGVRAALGVALTHLFVFTLLPRCLPLLAPHGRAAVAPLPTFGRRWLAGLEAHRLGIVGVVAAVSMLALSGLARLRADNDPLRLLPRDDQARVDHDRLAARLGGVERVDLLVDGDAPGSDPSRLLPFVAGLRLEPGVAGFAGPVLRGAEGQLAVPLLLAPGGSAVRAPLFDRIEAAASVLGLGDVAPAGPPLQIARDSARLIDGLLASLALSVVALTIAIGFALRSLRLAVLAMLPNLLPSLWLYGGLGWFDHPVSVATAMIGCTMLGLVVDNTLHLLHHYRAFVARDGRRRALREALDRCGRAISRSSLVLMLGFAAAAASRLETTVEFALLATTTIGFAWLGTAVVLPLFLLAGPRMRPAPVAAAARPGSGDAD